MSPYRLDKYQFTEVVNSVTSWNYQPTPSYCLSTSLRTWNLYDRWEVTMPISLATQEVWRQWTDVYLTNTYQSNDTWEIKQAVWRDFASDSARETWGNWTFIQSRELRLPPTDPEVLRQQRERLEERHRAARDAKVRARALLENVLAPEQRAELEATGSFHVRSSRGRRFCIRTSGISGNVDWVGDDGRVLGRFCAHPTGVPDEDVFLTQMLALETDEDSFLRVANLHAGARP